MADNNHNIIKPAESFRNITGITAAKRREERKKRQNSHTQADSQQQNTEDKLNESIEEKTGNEIAGRNQNEHTIDYCA